jgi:hypothetical protein
MWTLVIITLVATPAIPSDPNSLERGGVGTTTAFLNFPDQSKCTAAATTIGVGDTSFGGNPNTPAGTFRIIATCIARR